jgi:2Fe-2S ferredoxin
MPKVTYITADGKEYIADGTSGESLMQIAVDNLVPGIPGDCGGCCSCATCHAHVDEKWLQMLEPPSADETMMLEGGPSVRGNSRLTCQIPMRDALDGIILRIPE